MYGAVIGDIAGSKYEFNSIKTKEFPFISDGCRFTDDTAMTVAVAESLIMALKTFLPFKTVFVKLMQTVGREYPNAGYGGMFSSWLQSTDPKPYGSYGNGSAMRVSPCGLMAVSLDEAEALARASAEVTHDHPEGIKGAMAAAAAVFMAKSGCSMDAIREYISGHYYDLGFTLDEIRPDYGFDVTCMGSVPQSIEAFLESESYEDAVRNAVSLGGDSDTMGAITGGIAGAYFGRLDREAGRRTEIDILRERYGIDGMLPEDIRDVMDEFAYVCEEREKVFRETGECREIII